MLLHERARWALASAFCFALLVAPAIWNGFPLLQWDTGGYLARWYEGTLVPSRAVVYGLILNAGSWADFWPVVALQSALTIWVIAVTLRVHGLGRPRHLAGAITLLCVLTTLPFLSAILLTDIFCGLGILAFYLIVLRRDQLLRGERTSLGLVVAVAAATHSATLAVLLGLLASAAVAWLWNRKLFPARRLRGGFFAIALGAAMVLVANGLVARQIAWTPGGFALSFGRMLQDGIVNTYLDEHCPDPHLRLCAVKDQLPRDADEWFWGSSLFDSMGRFAGLGDEMEEIAINSLIAYPARQFEAAAVAFAKQLVAVHSGEGALNTIWHTYAVIEHYVPAASSAMHAARQQHGEISFTAINAVQWPATLLAMALLPFLVVRLTSDRQRTRRELAIAVLLAILGNAAVCGILSNPHDRYGARIAWLAMLAGYVALCSGSRPASRNDLAGA